jgi:hypothetical protein
MPSTMTPWEIELFTRFLLEKKSYIDEKVHSAMGKEIVNLVFAILQKELVYEMEEGERNFTLDKM